MRVLQGKYRLVSPIASGGMATVHLGKVMGLGGFERVVAIKLMHPHLLVETDYVQMFLDEARLAARIRHPNVVATLDVGQCEDGPFIVMEFIEGPTLAQIFKAQRRTGEALPLGVALRIFGDTLAGLHAAHELSGDRRQPLNLVHRDVSPQNVMVGLDGISRISDFGVARAEVRLSSTRSGQLKGKLGYLPPEQVRGEEVDRRADIYAAGVVLWEVLTGQRLFKAPSEASLMFRLLEGARERPSAFNPAVPDALDDACMRALALDREARYPTAADFSDALEQAAASTGIAIASPRRVAALVRALDIALPSASQPPPAVDPTVVDSRSQPSRASVTDAPSGSSASGTAAAVATAVTPGRQGRGGWLVAAVALTALTTGAAWHFLLSGGEPTATSAAPTAAAATAAAVATGSASVATAETPSASAPSSVPTASASAAAATPAPRSTRPVDPVRPTRKGAAPTAPPTTAPPSTPNADYQPGSL